MKNPFQRAEKRRKVVEMCLFIIQHEPNGIRAQELQRLVCDAFRFRCSSNTIGQYLRPLIDKGVLEKTRTDLGNAVYVYIPTLETETHGVETRPECDGLSRNPAEESEGRPC